MLEPLYLILAYCADYDNPELVRALSSAHCSHHFVLFAQRPRIVDSSGMRFWVTKTLRPIEAGVFLQGLFTDHRILLPPGHKVQSSVSGELRADYNSTGVHA